MHAVRQLLHGGAGYVWVNKEEIEALAAVLKLESRSSKNGTCGGLESARA